MDIRAVDFVFHWPKREVRRFKGVYADIVGMSARVLPGARRATYSALFSWSPYRLYKGKGRAADYTRRLGRANDFESGLLNVGMRGAQHGLTQYDWRASAASRSSWPERQHHFDDWCGYPGTYLALSVRAGLFDRLTSEARRHFVERAVERAVAGGAKFGFVELQSTQDSKGSFIYDGAVYPADWRLIHRESRWWAYGRERWKYIPSLYWGTFLGPQCMAKVLAANPDFVAQARDWTWVRRFDNTRQNHDQWLLDFKKRGVFLALCDDVLECWQRRDRGPQTSGLFCGYGGRYQQFATWVHRQFRAADILA